MNAALMLIAHEGGWDEILLVGAPILVIIGVLGVARRRVGQVDSVEPPEKSDGSD